MCKSQKNKSPCASSLFLADTDTGVIKKLGDFGLSLQQDSINRNVAVSPDGKMVAVGTSGGVDIVTMDGKIIRHDILPYKPSTSDVLFPSVFWLPDSSGLIVAVPDTICYCGPFDHLVASTTWRYTLASNLAVQIPFDPAPMGDTFQVSPDGKWIVYGGLGTGDSTVFLGNLANRQIKVVGQAFQYYFSWSPDSQHFMTTNAGSSLGAIDTSTLTPVCNSWSDWIDANHFLCMIAEGKEDRVRMAEIDAGAVKTYDLGFGKDVEDTLLIKPK